MLTVGSVTLNYFFSRGCASHKKLFQPNFGRQNTEGSDFGEDSGSTQAWFVTNPKRQGAGMRASGPDRTAGLSPNGNLEQIGGSSRHFLIFPAQIAPHQ